MKYSDFTPLKSKKRRNSIDVIYEAICNLLYEVRFKRENMLYLDLLSDPNEIKLHKINHYLSLIIDKLLEF